MLVSFRPEKPLITTSLILLCICLGIYIIYTKSHKPSTKVRNTTNKPDPVPISKPDTATDTNTDTDTVYEHEHSYENAYPPIPPVPPSFHWSKTPPLVFRPFKPKYHLTMGISTIPLSDLIPIDNTYKERLELRRSLLQEYPDVVRGVNINININRGLDLDPDLDSDRDCGDGSSKAEAEAETEAELNESIRDAIREWYAFVMGWYLPRRYPGVFRVVFEGLSSGSGSGSEGEEGKKRRMMLESTVTGLRAPIDPRDLEDKGKVKEGGGGGGGDMLPLLDTLGTWIDEDFLILLPDTRTSSNSSPNENENERENKKETGEDEPKYTLQAYTTYFPSGFDTRTKLGRRLADIHAPVPGYREKLQRSMDRFFARLEVGRVVARVNWSVMMPGTGLFAAFGGMHGDGDGDNDEGEEIGVGELDVENTFLRCERQTLHRMPRSKAIVFAFHTYTYPIREIKEEGLGEEMAVAIDGLKEGSVPRIHQYKRGPYWGEAVKAYLRS